MSIKIDISIDINKFLLNIKKENLYTHINIKL